jgi:serine/threonine protein kinase
MPLPTGQILNNRYRIVKLLGKGGFGAIYRAWDLNLNGPCAVKENFDTSPEAREQFAREASILYNLRHPNLPKVIDHFSLPGQGQYLVMEYIEGEDLQDIIDRTGGPLPVEIVMSWMEQVCDALIYMHCQNPPVVHRDIKPGNVRITPQGEAMLVDFGIAKLYDPDRKTTLGARAATPGYAPVEQYGQGSTDTRSDIYALGATLYAALTGVEPPESIYRHQEDSLAPAGQLNPQVSPQLEAAIMQAMALVPEKRFQSATEFRRAIFQSSPSVARVTGGVDPRIIPVVAEEVRPDTGPTTGPRPKHQDRRSRSIWKIVAPLALFLAVALVVGGLAAYAGFSNWLVGGPKNQTADAMAISTNVQKTRIELQAATLGAQKTSMAATETAMVLGYASSANETLQAQQATMQAYGTQAIAPTNTPASQVSPSPQANLASLLITDWKQGFFAQLSSGCKITGTPCWVSDDDFQKHNGSNMVLTSRERVLIDPDWPHPYLIFWHKYHFEVSASVSVEINGTWEDLELYGKGTEGWKQAYFDLSKYKGEQVLIRFSAATARWGSFLHNPPKTEWFLQEIQIIPDYSPST